MRLKSITSNIEMATMIISKIFTLAENALCISNRKNNDNVNFIPNSHDNIIIRVFSDVLIIYASSTYLKYIQHVKKYYA